jgi:plastocyanin
MRERTTKTRRAGSAITVAAAVAAAVAIAAPAASAAPANIIAGSGGVDPNLFSAPSYAHDAGTTAQMTWAAGGSHNVTSTTLGPDGKSLFSSATVGSGATPVNGTKYLQLGTYPFTCTIHPGMNSSLNVNAGTPLARPTIAVKLLSRSLSGIRNKGQVGVKVTLTGNEPATITLKLGKKKLSFPKTTTASGKITVSLTTKGKAALVKAVEDKRKATVKVEGVVDFGKPAKASGTVR